MAAITVNGTVITAFHCMSRWPNKCQFTGSDTQAVNNLTGLPSSHVDQRNGDDDASGDDKDDDEGPGEPDQAACEAVTNFIGTY